MFEREKYLFQHRKSTARDSFPPMARRGTLIRWNLAPKLLNVASGKVVLTIPGEKHLWTSVWGKPLHEVPILVAAEAAGDGIVGVWNLDSLSRILDIHDKALYSDLLGPLQKCEWLAASQSGTIIAWLTPEGEVDAWDLRAHGRRLVLGTIGKKRDPLLHHALVVSPDGRQVAVVEHKQLPNDRWSAIPVAIDIVIHRFAVIDCSYRELKIRTAGQQFVYPDMFSVFFSPSDKFLALNCGDRTVSVLDANTGRNIRSYSTSPPANYRDLILSSDIFCLTGENHCRFRPLRGIDRLKMLGWSQPRYGAVSPDGFYCFGEFSNDGSTKEVASGKDLAIVGDNGAQIFPRWFSPDGKCLITSADADSVHGKSPESVWRLCEFPPHARASSQRSVADLITDMESPDPTVGQIAVRQLAVLGNTAIPAIVARVRYGDIDGKIRELVEDLNNVDYNAREKATRSLINLGRLAQESLERTAMDTNSEEVRTRSKRVLATIEPSNVPPEEIAQLRASPGTRHHRIGPCRCRITTIRHIRDRRTGARSANSYTLSITFLRVAIAANRKAVRRFKLFYGLKPKENLMASSRKGQRKNSVRTFEALEARRLLAEFYFGTVANGVLTGTTGSLSDKANWWTSNPQWQLSQATAVPGPHDTVALFAEGNSVIGLSAPTSVAGIQVEPPDFPTGPGFPSGASNSTVYLKGNALSIAGAVTFGGYGLGSPNSSNVLTITSSNPGSSVQAGGVLVTGDVPSKLVVQNTTWDFNGVFPNYEIPLGDNMGVLVDGPSSELDLMSGASINSGNSSIWIGTSKNGTVEVDHAKLRTTGSIVVGSYSSTGVAALDASDGSTINSGPVDVTSGGLSAGVWISGGSKWTNTEITISGNSLATMYIGAGGSVATSGNAFIGYGGSGSVAVTGTSSSTTAWAIGGALVLGTATYDPGAGKHYTGSGAMQLLGSRVTAGVVSLVSNAAIMPPTGRN